MKSLVLIVLLCIPFIGLSQNSGMPDVGENHKIEYVGKSTSHQYNPKNWKRKAAKLGADHYSWNISKAVYVTVDAYGGTSGREKYYITYYNIVPRTADEIKKRKKAKEMSAEKLAKERKDSKITKFIWETEKYDVTELWYYEGVIRKETKYLNDEYFFHNDPSYSSKYKSDSEIHKSLRSITTFDENGKPTSIKKYVNGKQEGEDLSYLDGRLLIKQTYKNGKKHGLYESYRDNGNVKQRGEYKDGNLVGKIIEFDENGNINMNGPDISYHVNGEIKQKTNYVNGSKEGTELRYSPSGKIVYKVFYKDGVKEGPEEIYYENGKLQLKVPYVNGNKEGTMVSYYQNGNLKEKISYKGNRKDGSDETYFENGNLKWKYPYKDGNKNGYCEYYFENGNLRFRALYRNNEYSSIPEEKPLIQGWENGNIMEKVIKLENLNLYEKTSYNKEGKLVRKGYYVKTKGYLSEQGKSETYFSNGQLSSQIYYENGRYHGKYEDYNSDGKLRRKGEYIKGEKFTGIYYRRDTKGNKVKREVRKNGKIVKLGYIKDDRKIRN